MIFFFKEKTFQHLGAHLALLYIGAMSFLVLSSGSKVGTTVNLKPNWEKYIGGLTGLCLDTVLIPKMVTLFFPTIVTALFVQVVKILSFRSSYKL